MMKLADKAWFIERIQPYLMPGEFVREFKGCVHFFSEVGGDQYQGQHLWVCSPTGMVSPSQRAVCHFVPISKGSVYATCQALTPRRTGKDWKERMLDDFIDVSGLKNRDLEACRKARTRKKLIAAFCSSTTTKALREAGHTILPNEVSSDEMLEQMRTAHGLVCGNIHDGAFMCGMAYALGKQTYYEDDGTLNELLEALDK